MHAPLQDELIVKADLSSLEIICDFQMRLAFESEGLSLNETQVKKGVRKAIEDKDNSYYLLYKVKEKTVACLLIQKEWSDWRAKSVLWIHSVYVLKEFRRLGIFKKIYLSLQAQVKKDPSLTGLRLFVDKTNTHAISTYEALQMDASHYHLYEWMS